MKSYYKGVSHIKILANTANMYLEKSHMSGKERSNSRIQNRKYEIF